MINCVELDKLNSSLSHYDLFICCSSFESRCLSIASAINHEKISKSLIVYNNDSYDQIIKNRDALMTILGESATTVAVTATDSLAFADALVAYLSDYPNLNRILVDVTCFTHEYLFILLRILKTVFCGIRVTCLYANASNYSSTEEKNKKWLSRGIGEIRSVLGYSGNILSENMNKVHLIIISGYEYDRALAVINTIEPNYISIGYGFPEDATTEFDRDANQEYTNLIERMTPSYAELSKFHVCCNDPYVAKQEIEEEISKIENRNVVLVAMNNKISTVGAALAAIANDGIQVCYAPASVYNTEDYSTPGQKYYMFDLT